MTAFNCIRDFIPMRICDTLYLSRHSGLLSLPSRQSHLKEEFLVDKTLFLPPSSRNKILTRSAYYALCLWLLPPPHCNETESEKKSYTAYDVSKVLYENNLQLVCGWSFSKEHDNTVYSRQELWPDSCRNC